MFVCESWRSQQLFQVGSPRDAPAQPPLLVPLGRSPQASRPAPCLLSPSLLLSARGYPRPDTRLQLVGGAGRQERHRELLADIQVGPALPPGTPGSPWGWGAPGKERGAHPGEDVLAGGGLALACPVLSPVSLPQAVPAGRCPVAGAAPGPEGAPGRAFEHQPGGCWGGGESGAGLCPPPGGHGGATSLTAPLAPAVHGRDLRGLRGGEHHPEPHLPAQREPGGPAAERQPGCAAPQLHPHPGAGGGAGGAAPGLGAAWCRVGGSGCVLWGRCSLCFAAVGDPPPPAAGRSRLRSAPRGWGARGRSPSVSLVPPPSHGSASSFCSWIRT